MTRAVLATSLPVVKFTARWLNPAVESESNGVEYSLMPPFASWMITRAFGCLFRGSTLVTAKSLTFSRFTVTRRMLAFAHSAPRCRILA